MLPCAQLLMASPTTVTIVLGTASALKLKAIQNAFNEAKESLGKVLGIQSLTFEFETTTAKSGVNEQPYGWEEIIKGANNRVKNALEICKDKSKARVVVTCENGVVELPANGPDYYMDIGWVVLLDVATNKQYVSSSTSVSIPAEVVQEVKQIGMTQKTIGDVMHKHDSSVSTKDPHHKLMGGLMNRVPLMQQAVSAAIGQWMCALKEQSH